ncbi:MAG: DUF2852 domain-containing protein [Hyphomicrobiales bacterium]|nr:DUF2852 domain-containing protein [Hyphomicrobiales bacterium]
MMTMCGHRYAYAGDGDHAGAPASGHGPFGGPGLHAIPLPVKLLGVAGAFWIAPPLGLAALGYWAWRASQARCGHSGTAAGGHESGPMRWRGGFGRGHWAGGRFGRGGTTGNSAFDDKRRETLRALDEEAEAFAAFRRERRAKREREEFDRFMAERRTKDAPDAPPVDGHP